MLHRELKVEQVQCGHLARRRFAAVEAQCEKVALQPIAVTWLGLGVGSGLGYG